VTKSKREEEDMAMVRQVLGHVSVEIAQRRRKCHRDPKKHEIPQNGPCLIVAAGRFERKNYCPDCAKGILEKAKADLDRLVQEIAGTLASPISGG
jgi:hypothetical protein